MTKELFTEIYEKEICPFLNEIQENNSQIKRKNTEKCIDEIYNAYSTLNKQYKNHVFASPDECLLDRHRLASCICGAFLKISVFDKTQLIHRIKTEKQRMEAVFYYVNELAAFYAGCKYLSFFMMYDKQGNESILRDILENFPIMPNTAQIKKGFWNCVLFNLSQIKNDEQIGLDHYDLYAYAMFFFYLEKTFYDDRAFKEQHILLASQAVSA